MGARPLKQAFLAGVFLNKLLQLPGSGFLPGLQFIDDGLILSEVAGCDQGPVRRCACRPDYQP